MEEQIKTGGFADVIYHAGGSNHFGIDRNNGTEIRGRLYEASAYGGRLILYGLCFFLLSRAIEHIHLGITYATWSGVGIVVTTLVSVFLFHQRVNLPTVLGIVLVLTGCVLMNLFGTPH